MSNRERCPNCTHAKLMTVKATGERIPAPPNFHRVTKYCEYHSSKEGFKELRKLWQRDRRKHFRDLVKNGLAALDQIPKSYKDHMGKVDPEVFSLLGKVKRREIRLRDVPSQYYKQVHKRFRLFKRSKYGSNYYKKRRREKLQESYRRRKAIEEKMKMVCMCCGLRKESSLYKPGDEKFCGECLPKVTRGLSDGKTIAMICGITPIVEEVLAKYERKREKRKYQSEYYKKYTRVKRSSSSSSSV